MPGTSRLLAVIGVVPRDLPDDLTASMRVPEEVALQPTGRGVTGRAARSCGSAYAEIRVVGTTWPGTGANPAPVHRSGRWLNPTACGTRAAHADVRGHRSNRALILLRQVHATLPVQGVVAAWGERPTRVPPPVGGVWPMAVMPRSMPPPARLARRRASGPRSAGPRAAPRA